MKPTAIKYSATILLLFSVFRHFNIRIEFFTELNHLSGEVFSNFEDATILLLQDIFHAISG